MSDNYKGGQQTGGDKKRWSFDHNNADMPAPIRDALVHHDTYFDEDEGMTTLAIVMDKVLEDLPKDLADAVTLVHINNQTYRAAAKILGVDHKTVKARVIKGVGLMRKRLVDSVWIAEMLKGYLPADEVISQRVEGGNVAGILKTLGDTDEQE